MLTSNRHACTTANFASNYERAREAQFASTIIDARPGVKLGNLSGHKRTLNIIEIERGDFVPINNDDVFILANNSSSCISNSSSNSSSTKKKHSISAESGDYYASDPYAGTTKLAATTTAVVDVDKFAVERSKTKKARIGSTSGSNRRISDNRKQVAELKALVKNPRLKFISGSEVEGGYVYTDVNGVKTRFCGLLSILEAVCYPTYDYNEALKSAPIPKRFKMKTGLSRPWHGRKRGKFAHDSVRLLVNGGEEAREAMYGTERSENADHFIASLKIKELRPLVAEYIVYEEQLRIASGIDLVCMTSKQKESRLSLIELKVFCNGFEHSNDNLKNPPSLRHLSNCALHQAFLQLAFYRRMIEVQHPEVKIGTCYVAQETQTHTHYHRLPDEFIAASGDILACVFEYRYRQLVDKAGS